MDAQIDVATLPLKLLSSGRTILTSAQTLTGGHLTQNFRWEFGGGRSTEQFVQFHLYCCTYAARAFVDERMKILLTLSFSEEGWPKYGWPMRLA